MERTITPSSFSEDNTSGLDFIESSENGLVIPCSSSEPETDDEIVSCNRKKIMQLDDKTEDESDCVDDIHHGNGIIANPCGNEAFDKVCNSSTDTLYNDILLVEDVLDKTANNSNDKYFQENVDENLAKNEHEATHATTYTEDEKSIILGDKQEHRSALVDKILIDSSSDSLVIDLTDQNEDENLISPKPVTNNCEKSSYQSDGSFSSHFNLSGASHSYSKNETSDCLPSSKQSFQLLAERERILFEINEVKTEVEDKQQAMKSINLATLPDNGIKLKVALERDKRNLNNLKEQYERVDEKINSLLKDPKKVSNNENELTKAIGTLPSVNVDDFGKRALENYRVEQSLTVDSLRKLHSSLNTCPDENTEVTDPGHLRVQLMLHQKQALAWLLWRESQIPSGGILADDMGLGKTLTMLSLIIKKNEADSDNESDDDNDDDDDDVVSKLKTCRGGTLIICPSSLLGQWESEIENKIKSKYLTYQIFHGGNREKRVRKLAKFDIVITSYSIVRVEGERIESARSIESVLYSMKWQRVILDEAHVIRNHKSKTASAVFKLRSKHRWALTGTPVHNKTQDFFALIKFLRCKPFDDITVWKKWVEAKDETGVQRMNMLTKALLLRRTKAVLTSEGKLGTLPEKTIQDIIVNLGKEEFSLYEIVSNFSQTLLGQLLYQKAEKENLLLGGAPILNSRKQPFNPNDNPFAGNPVLDALYKRVVNMNNVKTHEILVLLLRLRQICCHPALMKSMIETETLAHDGIHDGDGSDLALLEGMSSLALNDGNTPGNHEAVNAKEIWDISNPIFKPTWKSSKVQAIIDLLENELLQTDDKIVIVSQWTSMLELLQGFLKEIKHCAFDCLTGQVPIPKRMQIVNEFNNSSSRLRVLLLSLTAGGVGLNLIGGNHLILIDLHWNPQLEAQACDRVYRVGQKKPVKIYKFICTETIEERIQLLQQEKLQLADDVLTGAKHIKPSHLSLNDLKMLFNVK